MQRSRIWIIAISLVLCPQVVKSAESLCIPLADNDIHTECALAHDRKSVDSLAENPTPMLDSLFNLNEVVVTGQGGAIKSRRLSSHVTKVSGEDLSRIKLGRMEQLLQDQVPNIQIGLSSSQVGTTSIFRSRGLSSAQVNSTPVIYVDGVRVDNNNTTPALLNSTLVDLQGNVATQTSLSDIPMENIDHIEFVPGGAATTLYGSDAANGVLQIFTRMGQNHKPLFWAGSQIEINTANSQWYRFKRTKELLHQTGIGQKYSFGFDGGTDRFGYSFAGSMYSNTGTLIEDGNRERKYDMRFGSRVKFNSMLEYRNSFGMVFQDYERRRNGNQGDYTGLWFCEGGAASYFSYTAQDGSTKYWDANLDNLDDYAYAQMREWVRKAEGLQDDHINVRHFQTSQQLLFQPLKGLTFKGIFGVDYRTSNEKNKETHEYYELQQGHNATTHDGAILNFQRDYLGITIDLSGQYNYRPVDWLSTVTAAGFQFFSTSDHQIVFNGIGIRDGASVISGASEYVTDEWKSYLYSTGFYVQENVGFWDRYYLDLGLRVDHNTAFGDNVSWQYYPKVGVSYVMSDEPWLRTAVMNGWINSLKLLANYGVAGNYPPAFEYQRTVTLSPYLGQNAAQFGKYGNPDLGPERKHSVEVGFESTLLHNVLHLGLTYYYSRTKDALFSIPTLPSSGQASTYLANVGEILNRGWELSASVQVVKTRNWDVNLRASLNTNYNEVLETGQNTAFAIGGFTSGTIQEVVDKGQSIGFLRGNRAILNEDGTLKEVEHLANLGKTLPDAYGNFGLTVNWKRFTFMASGDYQVGGHVFSFDRMFRFSHGIDEGVVPQSALKGLNLSESWTSFTNFFVEKADFVKLRDIGLEYTLPLKHVLREVNVAFHVYNALAWTAATVDPEACLGSGLSQGGVTCTGINYASFSAPRQFIASVKVAF